MDAVLAWLTQQSPAVIYAVAGLLLAGEVGLLIGIAIPAATIMLSLGALASAGHLRLGSAIAVAVVAGLLGDSIGYWEGRLIGPRLCAGRLGLRVGADRWRRAERAVRCGALAIALGRWTAFVRTLVPRVAGAAGVRYGLFLAYDAAAVLVWMPGTVLIGCATGSALP